MSFRFSKSLGLGVVASALFAGGMAYAGASVHDNVSVTSTSMTGTFYGARHSSHSTDYLRCFVTGTVGDSQMGCTAVANGVYKSCTSYTPGLVQAATSLTSHSSITVYFNSSGECTQLSVYDSSTNLP